jgi:hypothetical protein
MLLFHGTAADILPEVKVHGLVPHAGNGSTAWARKFAGAHFNGDDEGERAESVYLATEKEHARMFASFAAAIRNNKPVIIYVELPSIELVQLPEVKAVSVASSYVLRSLLGE